MTIRVFSRLAPLQPYLIAVVSASIPRLYSLVVRYKRRFIGLIAADSPDYHAEYEPVRACPLALLVGRLSAWAGALPRSLVWHLFITSY